MTKKELQKVEDNNALAEHGESSLTIGSIFEHSNAGSQNVAGDDLKTPFLQIIQQLSPYHQKSPALSGR